MNIDEARNLLSVDENASIEEILNSFDLFVDSTVQTGDMATLRRALDALAELMVDSGRFSRTQADEYVSFVGKQFTVWGSKVDQNLAWQREVEARRTRAEMELASLLDELRQVEAEAASARATYAEAESAFDAAEAALERRQAARRESRDAWVRRFRQVFSFFSRK